MIYEPRPNESECFYILNKAISWYIIYSKVCDQFLALKIYIDNIFLLFPKERLREREREGGMCHQKDQPQWFECRWMNSWNYLRSRSWENRYSRCQWGPEWVGWWKSPVQYRMQQALVQYQHCIWERRDFHEGNSWGLSLSRWGILIHLI